MTSQRRRIVGLIALSSGTVLASGCDVADQVLATIGFAFRIVDIWV
ncbi:MAG: hypothetical protein ACE5I3_16080 [Phycisphaerae bacterium]